MKVRIIGELTVEEMERAEAAIRARAKKAKIRANVKFVNTVDADLTYQVKRDGKKSSLHRVPF